MKETDSITLVKDIWLKRLKRSLPEVFDKECIRCDIGNEKI